MRRVLMLTLLCASPAVATGIDQTGRYTCTSDEGWKYYYDIHALDGTTMIYSRGHNDVLTGWETSCHGTSFPIFEYCRDLDRIDDDASSAPHDRLSADCAVKGKTNG